MHPWVAASSIAVLVTTVPLCWVYRVLQDLPEPLALSHRRWSLPANLAIIVVATATTALFVRRLYYAAPAADPTLGALSFMIAAPVYILAFVLLIRQHAGLYPEYFVAAGRGGFTVRKRLYQNVVRIEEKREFGAETELLVYLRSRERLSLTLATRDLDLVYRLIEDSRPRM